MLSRIFQFLDLILRRPPERCRKVTQPTHWKNFFNKVSDKLLGQLLVLPAAELRTACTKLVYGPRSLSLTLLKKSLQKVDKVTPWHPLVLRRKIKSINLNLGQPLIYSVVKINCQ